jgi:hypothetical protein
MYNIACKIVIYTAMIGILIFFIVSYFCILKMGEVKYTMHPVMIPVFYLITGILIGVSSIHFICEIKRNFGPGTFEEATNNVFIIVVTIICSFTFNVILFAFTATKTKFKPA